MGFPNDKCQCPQEQNVMKSGGWCGFGTLICAWAGEAQSPPIIPEHCSSVALFLPTDS